MGSKRSVLETLFSQSKIDSLQCKEALKKKAAEFDLFFQVPFCSHFTSNILQSVEAQRGKVAVLSKVACSRENEKRKLDSLIVEQERIVNSMHRTTLECQARLESAEEDQTASMYDNYPPKNLTQNDPLMSQATAPRSRNFSLKRRKICHPCRKPNASWSHLCPVFGLISKRKSF